MLKTEPFRQGQGGGTEGITNELTVMTSGKGITGGKMRLAELKQQAWYGVL